MNAAKDKGTQAETAVVNYLRPNGFPEAERRALRGTLDAGDVAGILACVIEIKNHAERQRLAEWMTELVHEMEHAGAEIGAVWHKRRGKGSPGDWYVTMPGWVFVHLLNLRKRLAFLERTK